MSSQVGMDRYNTPENRRQVGRFLIMGGSSAATDFACYLLLTERLAISVHTAKGLAYLAGMVVGYFGNKYWTFGSARRSLSEPAAYVALYATTLLVNIAINSGSLFLLGSRYKILAFLTATGTTMVLNFLGLRLVTFRVGIRQRRAELATNDATCLREAA